jgi:hypothetical protein
MPSGGTSSLRESATITLRLDTTQAKRDLDRFMGSVRGATLGVGGMAERITGGDRGGGGAAAAGPGLGALGGRAAAFGGAVAAPFIGGAMGVVRNGLDWLNAPASHAYGTDYDEIENAAQSRTEQRTLQALRGIRTTPEQSLQVYNAFKTQEGHLARTEKEHVDQLHRAFDVDRSKILSEQSERHLEAIERAVTGIGKWLAEHSPAGFLLGVGR